MNGLATAIVGSAVLAVVLFGAAALHHWEGTVKAAGKLGELHAASERRLEAESAGRADLEGELDALAAHYRHTSIELDDEREDNAHLRAALAAAPDLDELRNDPQAFLEHFEACPTVCYALHPELVRSASKSEPEVDK